MSLQSKPSLSKHEEEYSVGSIHVPDIKKFYTKTKINLTIVLTLLFIILIRWITTQSKDLMKEKQQQKTIQKVYSSEELQKAILQMQKRPQGKIANFKGNKFKPTKQAYFAYRLYSQDNNSLYLNAEKYYYQQKYNIKNYQNMQLPICVVSSGRNVVFQNRYIRFLNSVQRQQYTNFKLIIVDDFSADQTSIKIKQYLSMERLIKLKNKINIIENKQRLYALKSRDIAITHYCGQNDIIVELDLDDQFIGRQVLQVINAIYSSKPQIWVMYSSYVYLNPVYGQPSQGISQRVSAKILQQGTYRLTTQYLTSATRTFRKQLYDKIDKTDFINQEGNFYKWTSDLFVHYSLVQLAGFQHYQYVHQIFYFYYRNHNPYKSKQKAIDRLNALSIRPYKKLQNLTMKAQRISQWSTPQWIKQQKLRLQKQIQQEVHKF